MLLSMQFPLVDLRRLQQKRTGMISRPGWPAPFFDPNLPEDALFMRGFGQMRRREMGGLDFWGEDIVCDARRVVRWKGPAAMPRSGQYGQYAPLPFQVAFRNFFFDGAVVGKCEVGIATTGKRELHMDVQRLTDIHLWFLQHDVSLPSPCGTKRSVVPLHTASPLLQAALRRATTRSTWSDGDPHTGWIAGGAPMLFCQMREPLETLSLNGDDSTVRLQSPEAGIRLACYQLRFGTKRVPLWVMSLLDGVDRTRARQLRLCLLRMHAEHEALRVVLHQLDQGRIVCEPGSPATEALQAYLRDRHRRLFRNRSILRRLLQQQTDEPEVDDLAIGLMERVWPGQLESLQTLLQQINVRRNIGVDFNQDAEASLNIKEFYVARNVIRDVSGSNIIQDSTVENSNVGSTVTTGLGEDKRKQLADLQKELAQATKDVPAEHKEAADAVVESAKDTVDKATKPKPNATSVQISAKGMLEAAKGIASVVPIALSIAEKIAKVVTGG